MNSIITVGETMVSFVSHEAVPISYSSNFKMYIAGAESNTAIGLQKLGNDTYFISRVGNDTFGEFIIRTLRAEGVHTEYLSRDAQHSTSIMFKEPLPNRETNVYYYRENSAATYLAPECLPADLFQKASAFHFTGITPILSDSCKDTVYSAIELARSNNLLISFDPNIRLKLWKNTDYTSLMKDFIKKSDIVLLGLSEAKMLYGNSDANKLIELIYNCGLKQCVVLKDGQNGAYMYYGDCCIKIPAYPCQCIDPIGAGDAFNAGFINGVLSGNSFDVCGRAGAILGAHATEVHGDIEGLISKEQLDFELKAEIM